jgi:selenocysteine lyase/cysteine desulfurase
MVYSCFDFIMPTLLECQRQLFSLDDQYTYLNSAYMGPLPLPVQQAGEAALKWRAFPTHIGPADFFTHADDVRKLCAQLVNASAESIALIHNAAAGINIAALNLPARSGQNIVLLGELFPSNVYPWFNFRERGVEIRFANAPVAQPGANRTTLWNQSLVSLIDSNTVAVAVEQAHWTDGTLFDLVALRAACDRVGAALIIDATQTAAVHPLDCAAIKPDLLVVHSYKSMLCNYGLGFAVVGPRFAQGKPAEEHWLLRQGAEDFSQLVNYQDDYADGARRFDTSLRANPMMIMMLKASCELLLDWQASRIREYLLRITRPVAARLNQAGFTIAAEADRAANIFGIALPAQLDVQQVRQHLADKKIMCSVRGKALRVSPHVYNDEADLQRLANALLAL